MLCAAMPPAVDLGDSGGGGLVFFSFWVLLWVLPVFLQNPEEHQKNTPSTPPLPPEEPNKSEQEQANPEASEGEEHGEEHHKEHHQPPAQRPAPPDFGHFVALLNAIKYSL